MNKIIMIGGGKGGVGKSMVTMAMIDALLTDAKNIVVVESDDSNSDVFKAVNKLVPCETCNLDDQSGYINFGGIIEKNKNACIVVNTAARATSGIVEHSGIIADVVRELGRELVMLWPINRQRDSLELLKTFLDKAKGYNETYTVINTYFGPQEKFMRYNLPLTEDEQKAEKREPKIRERVTGTIIFPELNDLVADKLIDNRLALWTADKSGQLTISERSALRQFREGAKKALEVVYVKR